MTQDYKYYKIIWKNNIYLSNYINNNKYRNVKMLINILKVIHIDKVIAFKNKYGYEYIDVLIHFDKIDYNIPRYVFLNTKLYSIINSLYNEYGNNKHLGSFLTKIKPNISKVTQYNISNLFRMFVIACTKRFGGFEKWGRGNHGNKELNICNHFKKHVIDGEENWNGCIDTAEKYANFAINISKHMKNKRIHTNGHKVYLSGLCGKTFVIGRLDGKELGISSCYIIHDDNYNKKMNNIEQNTCFKF